MPPCYSLSISIFLVMLIHNNFLTLHLSYYELVIGAFIGPFVIGILLGIFCHSSLWAVLVLRKLLSLWTVHLCRDLTAVDLIISIRRLCKEFSLSDKVESIAVSCCENLYRSYGDDMKVRFLRLTVV